jgi:hypothetical protein
LKLDKGRSMICFDRRRTLFLLPSFLLARTETVFAQSAAKYLGGDIASAFELQQFAVSASKDHDFDDFVARSVRDRQRTADDATKSGVFDNPTRAVSDLQSSIGFHTSGIPEDYFSEQRVTSQINVIQFVDSAGVSLVPGNKDILPIGIPVVEPIGQKSEATDLTVCIDIALQTLGIVEEKKVIDEALKDPDIAAALHGIIPTLKTQDWKVLLKPLDHLINLLFLHVVLISAKSVTKRVAFGLVVRCVPILGWAYVVAALLIALKANYSRFSFA